VRRERVPRAKFFKCFKIGGHIRTLRLDLMPLCNRVFFCSDGRTGVTLIVQAILNLRITILFPSLLPAARLVRPRLPLLSYVMGILEEIQFNR